MAGGSSQVTVTRRSPTAGWRLAGGGRPSDNALVLPLPGRRPRPVAVGVFGPHPCIVPGARHQAADDGDVAGHALRASHPGAVHAGAVLHVVAHDGRTARVGRRSPGHVHVGPVPRAPLHQRHAGRDRRLGRVVNGDRDVDGALAAVAVLRLHPHRVARLGLPVVPLAGLGPELTAARNDGEPRRVRALQAVGQRVVVKVGRNKRGAEVRRRRDRGVAHRLGEAPGRAVGGERRHEVGRPVGRTAPGRRPVPVAVGVRRPHPHVVRGARHQAADARAGAGHALRTVGPGAVHAGSVLQVVGLDVRAARVGRRAPAHVQAGQAPRGRRHHRRGGRQRRLGRVENGDDVRISGPGAEGVRRFHAHQVGRIGLPVIPLADLRPDLAGAPIDGEIFRVHAIKGVDQDEARARGRGRTPKAGLADVRRRRDHSVAHRLREAPPPGVVRPQRNTAACWCE